MVLVAASFLVICIFHFAATWPRKGADGMNKGVSFLSDFMAFQDWLEEATAKGATMPKVGSRNFIWGPVASERERMTRKLAGELEHGGEGHAVHSP